jgi:hypothetical protein
MKRVNSSVWARYAGVFLLGSALVTGIGGTCSGRHAIVSAHRFVRYYRAIEETDTQKGFWERVALSLVLASADSPYSRVPTSS